MTFRAAGASNPALRNVQYAEFLIRATETTLIVNKTQLVGRYPTLDAARLALEGILIKNAASQRASVRLNELPKDFRYLDSSFVTTPAPAINYADVGILFTNGVYDHSGVQQRFQAITSPILLDISSSSPEVHVYAKSGSFGIPPNATIFPQSEEYQRVDGTVPFIVEPSAGFVRLKGYYNGGLENTGTSGTFTLATATITVKNRTTNTVLDTFVVTVTENNT
jgi:hypothetical protein